MNATGSRDGAHFLTARIAKFVCDSYVSLRATQRRQRSIRRWLTAPQAPTRREPRARRVD